MQRGRSIILMLTKKDLKERNTRYQVTTWHTRIWLCPWDWLISKVFSATVSGGHRIFRMPYFDPEGRMTIMQWNTAKQGVDYRIGPRETKVENSLSVCRSMRLPAK